MQRYQHIIPQNITNALNNRASKVKEGSFKGDNNYSVVVKQWIRKKFFFFLKFGFFWSTLLWVVMNVIWNNVTKKSLNRCRP